MEKVLVLSRGFSTLLRAARLFSWLYFPLLPLSLFLKCVTEVEASSPFPPLDPVGEPVESPPASPHVTSAAAPVGSPAPVEASTVAHFADDDDVRISALFCGGIISLLLRVILLVGRGM